ncbi:DUF1707 SHOCT-like domain-containing protein [Streptodolium elevatio]|uniref:DUF1707 domain-containing protein n=1 Tax=Streptodolium elevatio TaxID=3157996 RepID=A0ABV3DQJ8_9ACTN
MENAGGTGSDAARPVTAADRERVSGVLRERMASGDLSLGDYQTRLRRVRAAATAGELDAVLRDLPGRRDDAEETRTGGGAGPEASAVSAGAGTDSAAGSRRAGGCAGVLLLLVLVVLVAVAGAYS